MALRVRNDLSIREISDAYRQMVTLILSHVDPDNAPSRRPPSVKTTLEDARRLRLPVPGLTP